MPEYSYSWMIILHADHMCGEGVFSVYDTLGIHSEIGEGAAWIINKVQEHKMKAEATN